MRKKISFKNIDENKREDLKRKIEEFAASELEPIVEKVGKGRTRFVAHVEGNKSKGLYSVALRLHVPKKVLVCREEGKDIAVVLQAAGDALKEQLEKYASRVRKEDVWKRKARRAKLRKLKVASAERGREDRELYYDLVRQHMPQLERVVRHELTYMRAKGDLPPDYPRIEDVVDETLARAFNFLKEKSPDMSMEAWLAQIAIDVIAEEAAKFRTEEGMDALEKSFSPLEFIPEDEIFEFWQPDEMLTIEDLAAASPYRSVPDEPLEDRERRLYMYRLLTLLPNKWRQAINLVFLEEMPKEQVAKTLGVDEETVNRWIEHAESFLREKMMEAGYGPPETGSYFDYLILQEQSEEYKKQVENELKETLGISD